MDKSTNDLLEITVQLSASQMHSEIVATKRKEIVAINSEFFFSIAALKIAFAEKNFFIFFSLQNEAKLKNKFTFRMA